MGNNLELLKEAYKLLLEGYEILKEYFDYQVDIKDRFVDEENEIIIIKPSKLIPSFLLIPIKILYPISIWLSNLILLITPTELFL